MLFRSLTLGNSKLGGTLQAFERNGVGRILAEPNVTAVSGESAKFTAGGELPVPGGSSCDRTTASASNLYGYCSVSVTYKPYGVTLNFTPVVLSEGHIQLRIATEVTEIDNEHQLTFTSANVPGFRTRKNETTVELPSGAAIATAGLITTHTRQVVNGLPGLMNLPILGSLFRSRDYLREETELVIIVTPYIVKAVSPDKLQTPVDGLRIADDASTILLGQLNKVYKSKPQPPTGRAYQGPYGYVIE